ncbi:MAG: hypothetical protein ACXAC2_00330 [Candidatus Kariarchaeaceae archaeon]|jgi:hypothetical protein
MIIEKFDTVIHKIDEALKVLDAFSNMKFVKFSKNVPEYKAGYFKIDPEHPCPCKDDESNHGDLTGNEAEILSNGLESARNHLVHYQTYYTTKTKEKVTNIIRELNSLKISTDVQVKELKKLRDEI